MNTLQFSFTDLSYRHVRFVWGKFIPRTPPFREHSSIVYNVLDPNSRCWITAAIRTSKIVMILSNISWGTILISVRMVFLSVSAVRVLFGHKPLLPEVWVATRTHVGEESKMGVAPKRSISELPFHQSHWTQ